MRLQLGKLDYSPRGMLATHERTAFLFTGNSTVKTNGALVMGRGAALEVRDLYPGVDHMLGRKIEPYHVKRLETQHMHFPPPMGQTAYGLLWVATKVPCYVMMDAPSLSVQKDMKPDAQVRYTELHRPLGIFQVKFDYKANAQRDLIEYSAWLLGEQARKAPHWNYVMNYPGIGAGHLTEAEVLPILSRHLPDNVVLHK
jgi:hypothetical protein